MLLLIAYTPCCQETPAALWNGSRHAQHVVPALHLQVDGKSSLACYLMTLDRCYARLCAKYAQRAAAAVSPRQKPESGSGPVAKPADAAAAARASERLASANRGAPGLSPERWRGGPELAQGSPGPPPPPSAGGALSTFSLAEVDFCVFHSPFNKLVRKAFARLFYADHLRAAGLGAAGAQDHASNPDLRARISLRAAFAAAAASTAPARLGSEGASSAAELAEEDSQALGPERGHAQGPDRGARGASSAPDLRGKGSHPGAGQARAAAGVRTDAGAQAACCPPGTRAARQDAGDALGPASLAIHAAAGEVAAATCPPCAPIARDPNQGGAGLAPGPGSRSGPCAHPLDAFPADPAAFPTSSYMDRALEAAALRASAGAYEALAAPGTGLALDVGNMYTGEAHSTPLTSCGTPVLACMDGPG